jgi:hypothetical protein
MLEYEVQLNRISATQIGRIRMIGKELDINNGGYFDTRMGAINIWCGPDDKPESWEAEILPADLNYPRCIVGSLEWEWINNEAQLSLYICPYELQEQKKPIVVEDLVKWLEIKVAFLLEKSA